MAIQNSIVAREFATRLRKLRELAGLSQNQLAEKLKVSRGSISFYENMERTPDIEFLCNTADYFGVPVDYLLGYSDNAIEENIELGYQFGLSDAAIAVLKDHYYDDEIFSLLISNEKFEGLMKLLSEFINDDLFAPSQKEFTAFLISKMFIEIANEIRVKINYGKYTPKELKEMIHKNVQDHNITMQKYQRILEEQRAANEKQTKEWLEKDKEDREIRQKVREGLENGQHHEKDD